MSEATMHQQLDGMIAGYWISQAVFAAAKFDIAGRLVDGPKTVVELAHETSTHPGALHRLLRALASVGIFAEVGPHEFALTPMAELLRDDVPGSKRAMALMTGDEQFHAWGEIVYSIETGEVAFDRVYGKPIFQYLGENPEKARIFDAAMMSVHGPETAVILDAYEFSKFGVLADIGGGNGSTLAGILQKHTGLKGILFDLPHVVEHAAKHLAEAGVTDRCEVVGGNFFEAVAEGADAYIMRHIIHDWDDQNAVAILRNCHKAMPENGKLLVVESVIPPGNDRFVGKFLDLVMLLIPGGKERTEEEYRELFQQAGFTITRIVPTAHEVSVIEAEKL